MKEDLDIRWKQRYANFLKALSQLDKFVEKEHLSELEEQGLIKAFEYTYELAWNVLKDFLEYQGTKICWVPEMPFVEPSVRKTVG